jgi:hypothetical protein
LRILVEVQLVQNDNTAWLDWIEELAIFIPNSQGIPRLSGYRIRQALSRATSPGNHSLAVATTKGTVLDQKFARFTEFTPKHACNTSKVYSNANIFQ